MAIIDSVIVLSPYLRLPRFDQPPPGLALTLPAHRQSRVVANLHYGALVDTSGPEARGGGSDCTLGEGTRLPPHRMLRDGRLAQLPTAQRALIRVLCLQAPDATPQRDGP